MKLPHKNEADRIIKLLWAPICSIKGFWGTKYTSYYIWCHYWFETKTEKQSVAEHKSSEHSDAEHCAAQQSDL